MPNWAAWLKQEWATLMSAPLTFILSVVLGGVIGFGINEVLHQERMATQKEELDYVRQRAGIVPSENKYENLTTSELRPLAAKELVKFRDFIQELSIAYDRLFAENPRRQRMEQPEVEEREFNNKFLETGTQFQDRYDRTLKVNLILLQQAMRKRLPSSVISLPDHRYQFLNMNTFVLRELADDFERLLKSLP